MKDRTERDSPRHMSQEYSKTSEINQRVLCVIIGLVIISFLVNADRFVLGEAGPQRAHDGGDFFITAFTVSGEFWRAPFSALWDASIARGWPMLYRSPSSPQMLMSVFAAVIPPFFIWPTLQILLAICILLGSFFFLHFALRYSWSSALSGALLNIGLFYWFHEHDGVTSVILLPSLIGFLSVRKGIWPLIASFTGLLIIIGLSYPPGTIVLMPLTHLVLILVLRLPDRRVQLWRWAGFWSIYGLWHGPHIIGAIEHFEISNRALYIAGSQTQAFISCFAERILNISVISPGFVMLAFVTRKNIRLTLFAFGAILLIVLLSTFNQVFIRPLADNRQWFYALTISCYRFYYMVPLVVFLWGSKLLSDAEKNLDIKTVVRRIVLMALFAVTVGQYFIYVNPAFFGYFNRYALWIGIGLLLMMFAVRKGAITACLLALLFVLPLRAWYTRLWESPNQGNAFIENRIDNSVNRVPPRTVTIMRTCDSSDIFPAQAAAMGNETLDGIANYFDRAFAERWAFYVTEGSTGCTARFPGWSTRIELTAEDFHRNPERIMAWLWINGVEEIRAIEPLQRSDLKLVDKRVFRIQWYGDVTRYYYRFIDSVSRVFLLPIKENKLQDVKELGNEYKWLMKLRKEDQVISIKLQEYTGSRIAFAGEFPAGKMVTASVNYHPGWTLYIDGKRSPDSLLNGPFGMPIFTPKDGVHSYVMVFEGSGAIITIICIVFSIAFLLVLVFTQRKSQDGSEQS